MKISELKMLIKAAYSTKNKQPLMAWGAPGVGKSQSCAQAAKEIAEELKDESFGFIDRRLGQMDITDLMGLPMIEKGVMHFSRPEWLPTKGRGILFLDELVQATPSMQAAASSLILDRRVGEHVLAPGWMVMGAGNRKSDRAGVNAMPTHMRNRFVHVNVEVSVDEWIEWALQNDIDVRIIAFIKWRPTLLHVFDSQAAGEAFASPRSYEFMSNLLQAGIPDSLLLETARGTVGEGPATELVGFLRVFDKMPDIDALLLNPKDAPLVSDPATLAALTSALVHRTNKDNIERVICYFDRLKDAQRPGFAVKALKEISLAKPEATKTKAFIKWASDMAKFTN